MIDAYSFGMITVDGAVYRKDLIIYPDRVHSPWRRKEGHRLSIDDIREILDLRPDTLVIGTGASGLMKVPDEVQAEIAAAGIRLAVAATADAIATYNAARDRGVVVAALHLTC